MDTVTPTKRPPPTRSARLSDRSTLLTWAGLAVLMLIALNLRIPHMTRGLWFDEIFTASQATFNRSFGMIISFLAYNDPHPPLHYLAMRVYAEVFNLHAWPTLSPGIEWKLRMPSLLMGLAAIPAAYVAGRHFGRVPAWAAALAVAFSPLTLGESVEARMYASITLLTVTTWALILRGTPRALALAGLLNVLGIWQQVIYSVVLAAQLLYLLTASRAGQGHVVEADAPGLLPDRPRWKILAAVLLPSASIVLYVPTLLRLFREAGTGAGLRVDATVVAKLLFDTLTGTNNMTAVLLFALVVAGLVGALRAGRLVPVFAVTFFIPFLWLIGSLIVNISSMRYAGFTVPGFAIAVGMGIQEVTRWALTLRPVDVTRAPWAGAALSALLLTGYVGAQRIMDQDMRVLKEPWREFTAYMTPRMKDGDVVAALEAGRQMSMLYYLRTPVKFQNTHGGGDTIALFDAHRTWLSPDSIRTPVADYAKFKAWWDTVRANGRAKVVMQDGFELYLIEPKAKEAASNVDTP